jgi:hypothetical protein
MTDRPPPAPVRWEDLEDRADSCPGCSHWWVSHGVPGEDGYGCTHRLGYAVQLTPMSSAA